MALGNETPNLGDHPIGNTMIIMIVRYNLFCALVFLPCFDSPRFAELSWSWGGQMRSLLEAQNRRAVALMAR